jgi:hypothetical protein
MCMCVCVCVLCVLCVRVCFIDFCGSRVSDAEYIHASFDIMANKLSILHEGSVGWVPWEDGLEPRQQLRDTEHGARNITPVASAIVGTGWCDYRAICMRKIRHKSVGSQGMKGWGEEWDQNGGAHRKGSKVGEGMWLGGGYGRWHVAKENVTCAIWGYQGGEY